MQYEQAESNIVEVDAVAPSGSDAALLESIRGQLAILSSLASADETVHAQWRRLVDLHGAHVYLMPAIRYLFSGEVRADSDRRTAFDSSQSAFAADELLWIAEEGQRYADVPTTRAAFERASSGSPIGPPRFAPPKRGWSSIRSRRRCSFPHDRGQ